MFSMSFRKPIVVCLYVWVVKAWSYSVSIIFSIGFDAFLLYSPSTARASFWKSGSAYCRCWKRSLSSSTILGSASLPARMWYTVKSSDVNAFESAPICLSAAL